MANRVHETHSGKLDFSQCAFITETSPAAPTVVLKPGTHIALSAYCHIESMIIQVIYVTFTEYYIPAYWLAIYDHKFLSQVFRLNFIMFIP